MRESGRAMPEAASPHARATVEMLAGMPFESLWGITTLVISIAITSGPFAEGTCGTEFDI